MIVILSLMLGACGPDNSEVDQTQLTSTTQQIAQDFVATGDVEKARAALAGLEVANPNQWLLLVAEAAAKDQAAPAELVTALFKLTEALDLQSPILSEYATNHGLIAAPNSDQLTIANPSTEQQKTVAIANLAQDTVVQAASGVDTPTATAEALAATATPEATAAPTATATTQPDNSAALTAQILASSLVNLRSGPGTDYDVAGGLQVGESATILARNQDASWWKIQLNSGAQAWVFAQLVQSSGAIDTITIASDIPPPPTAAAVAVVQPTEAPTAVAQTQPTATAAAPQQNSGAPYFKLISRRMWSKAENGDCRGQHLLRINVIDANGARLNGVTLQGLYTGATLVTGSQGKGDGVIEYDLYGTGEGFIVTTDSTGSFASSDRAEGFTTQSRDIYTDNKQLLIDGGYCSDDATCQVFYESWGCNGHHSWEATFQRNY